MTANHTPGRLFVSEETPAGTECFYNPDLYLEIVGYGTIGEIGGGQPDERRANARRIVAAWNACEGLSTEALESGVVRELADVLAKLGSVFAHLRHEPEYVNDRKCELLANKIE